MAIKIRVKLVPRLREAGMSQNEIARSQGMSRHSVGDVVAGARGLGIGGGGYRAKARAETGRLDRAGARRVAAGRARCGVLQHDTGASGGTVRHRLHDLLHAIPQEDWLARLGADVRADAIMDRIVHNTVWVARATST